MLAQPHVAVTEFFGGLRLLDPACVNLLRRTARRRLHEQECADVHRLPSVVLNDFWSSLFVLMYRSTALQLKHWAPFYTSG